MKLDMSAQALDARLREVSRIAGSLRAETRLSTKLDLSPAGIDARLREASALYELCRELRRSSSTETLASKCRTASS